MKTGIRGAERIGGILGKMAQTGSTIQFGLRNPNKLEAQDLITVTKGNATVSSIADAIELGDVIFFAFPIPTTAL